MYTFLLLRLYRGAVDCLFGLLFTLNLGVPVPGVCLSGSIGITQHGLRSIWGEIQFEREVPDFGNADRTCSRHNNCMPGINPSLNA